MNKGADAVYFYAAKGDPYGLIPDRFFSSVDRGSRPGIAAAGKTLQNMARFASAFGGRSPVTHRRSPTLTKVADQHNYTLWSGRGTAAHPSLLGRDMLAVLPFQTSDHSFAIPVYVMTENLATDYNASAPLSDVARYDLPDETFRISLSGVSTAHLSIRDYDPIRGHVIPVRWSATSPDDADITLSASDYPRVLQISDRG